MSVLFATLVWLLFSYSADTISRSFEAPIEFRNLPAGWSLDSDTVPSALVTLAGSQRAFAVLDGDGLAVSFDLSEAEPGLNVLTINSDNFNLPSGLRLTNVNPRQIHVTANPRLRVEVPVRPGLAAALPDSVIVVTQPRTVNIVLPQGLAVPDSVSTAPVDLGELLRSGSVTVGLELPVDIGLAEGESGEVTVSTRRQAL